MVPAVVEVKVVNMGLSPSLSASQREGLSTMGYRHTEPFAKSATQREMLRSGLGGIYNIQIEEIDIFPLQALHVNLLMCINRAWQNFSSILSSVPADKL